MSNGKPFWPVRAPRFNATHSTRDAAEKCPVCKLPPLKGGFRVRRKVKA